MFTIVLLLSAEHAEVTHWDDAPLVREWNGREVSLRAGPRERTAHGQVQEQVAVYVPDELNEEEFQGLFHAHKDAITELRLHD